MGDWTRKLRGFLGLSAVGGLIGSVFGVVRVGFMAILGTGGLSFDLLLQTAMTYGAFAGIATGGVGVLLATAGSRLSLQELSPVRAGLVGALLGAAAPVVFLLATWSGIVGWASLASVAVRFGLLGGVLGGGLVAVAKQADLTLSAGREDPALLDRP